jgi:hypothetical protein
MRLSELSKKPVNGIPEIGQTIDEGAVEIED